MRKHRFHRLNRIMETHKHGGNLTRLSRVSGLPEDEILDFSANINPLGLPEWFRSVVSASLSKVVHYPDPDCTELVEAIAAKYEVSHGSGYRGERIHRDSPPGPEGPAS